jgi:hypothetical protein
MIERAMGPGGSEANTMKGGTAMLDPDDIPPIVA